MADMQQLSTSKRVISGKPYRVASPLGLPWNKMFGFRGECALKNFTYNGLVITVDFNMRNIWKTVPDS